MNLVDALPEDHLVIAFEGNEVPKGDIVFLASFSRIADSIVANGFRDIGHGVFRYGVAPAHSRPDATVWVLQFYGGAYFFALTLPKEESRAGHLPRVVA